MEVGVDVNDNNIVDVVEVELAVVDVVEIDLVVVVVVVVVVPGRRTVVVESVLMWHLS